MKVKEFKGISDRTRQLLNTQESNHLDYKRSIEGLKCRDIVAFANSKNGGTILIGIDEIENNGLQRGKVVGCHIGDDEKLKIISKAQSCIPEIEVKIFIENLDNKPFYRIEIPSGKYKPYCTAKGLYMLRGDGRNNPLTPNNLLNIFLEEQGKEFIERFSYATKKLDQKLSKTKNQIESLNVNVNALMEDINNLSEELNKKASYIYREENKSSILYKKIDYLENLMSDILDKLNTVKEHNF
ncbi:MAG: RNA-binding domain-containing protein [Actinomycetota bacterium]